MTPLYELMHTRPLLSRVIHGDDTGVKLRVPGSNRTTKAHLWAYIGDPNVYHHNRTGEDNANAHLKRQVMGREAVVAITKGKLDFGPWEQIFYGEFDGNRLKRVLVKVIGESSGRGRLAAGGIVVSRANVLTVASRTCSRRPHVVVADLVIDGRPLLELCEGATGRSFDLVSPFGWTSPDHQLAVAERLLLTRRPRLLTGRRELLVCPECADLGCGCISAAVRREGGRYIWSEIGYETDYDPDGLSLFPMGAFSIAAAEFARLLAVHVAGLKPPPE